MAENNYCKGSYLPYLPDTSSNKNLLANSVFADEFADIITNFESTISTVDASTITTVDPIYNAAAVALNDLIVNNYTAIETSYPNIITRITLAPFITPVEIDTFTTDYYYDPTVFIDIARTPVTTTNNQTLLTKLDYFFSSDTVSIKTMGAFCALVPSIFAGIKEFSNFFNNITSLTGKIDDFIGGIGDTSTKALMETLKKQVLNVIDGIVEEIKAKMERFGFGFVDGNLTFSNQRIMSKIHDMKSKIESFFSEENIQHIKDQITALIAFSLSMFEKPSIEEIQYLIYRFCALIGIVEGFMSGMTAPLDKTVGTYSTTKQLLVSRSSMNTARAQSAGALRYAPISTGSKSYVMREEATARVQSSGRYAPLKATDYEGIIGWNDGNGVAGKVIFPAKLGGMGREGWEGASTEVKAYFCRGQAEFGRELRVNSAYRSRAYNATIKGAAKNSMHMSGEAIDSSFDGIQGSSLRMEYLEIMYNAGFEWFNWYPNQNFIHLDNKRRGSDQDLSRLFGVRKEITGPVINLPQSTNNAQ